MREGEVACKSPTMLVKRQLNNKLDRLAAEVAAHVFDCASEVERLKQENETLKAQFSALSVAAVQAMKLQRDESERRAKQLRKGG